jgi:rRNA-processing protein FCF1
LSGGRIITEMKKQRVYIDTSVIGGCFDDEFAVWSNGLFEDFRNGLFQPVLSKVVAIEIEKAPESVKDKFSDLIEYGAEILETTSEIRELAGMYLKRGILSEKCLDDLLHIATATIANVDMLVSWNFNHIVHYDRIRMFNGVNLELSYKPIAIHTPREVTSYGKEV